jgi:hypothetical protein
MYSYRKMANMMGDVLAASSSAQEPVPVPVPVPVPTPEPECKICLDTVCDLDPSSHMISPCKCSGTMKYVHFECLREWIINSDGPNIDKCPDCHNRYDVIIVPIAEHCNVSINDTFEENDRGCTMPLCTKYLYGSLFVIVSIHYLNLLIKNAN